jgi:hypothetical protein
MTPTQTETPPAVQMSAPAYKRLTPAQMHLILQLAAEERQQIDIADIVGVHVSTISRFLKQIGDPHKVVQQVMQGDSLQALTDWKVARRKAAKRGDHRPSREWLEAAYPELRPQQASHAGGGGVTVIVAVPGGDQNPRPAIQVLEAVRTE